MKILLLAFFISAAYGSHCKGLYLNQKYYNVDIIKEGINRIHELVFNRNDNTAYFTFEQIAKVPTRALGYVKLDDKSSGIIEGVRNATGLAIDQNSNRLYIGGSDGLFFISLHQGKKQPIPIDSISHDIRNMFVKNDIVYFVNSEKVAYKFEYSQVRPVFELQGYSVDKLVLDDDNNIMFLHNNTARRVRIGTTMVSSHEKVYATDVAVDFNYKPYVTAKDGLYIYNKYTYVLDKVGDLKDIRELAFTTAGEPLYVVVDTLVRLTYNPVPCYGD